MSFSPIDFKLRLLRLYKVDLESSFQKTDLLNLSQQLLKKEVLSQEINDSFAALDQDNLDQGIKIRYLLQQTCERLTQDEKVFDELTEVLHGFGGPVRDVYEAIMKELPRVRGDMCSSVAANVNDDHAKNIAEVMHKGEKRHVTDISPPASKKPHLSRTTQISNQSCDTRVVEGKSTLMEVQMGSDLGDCYQWYKNGQPLLNGVDFSGVLSNILYISKVSKSSEGIYCCRVTADSETVCSADICLRVIYSPEKECLMKQYLESRECNDSIMPIGNFISNSLYHIVPGSRVISLTKIAKVEYEEVFGEYKEGKLIIIEGPHGCGKTTLINKITRDWASGENILQGATMVILINLKLLLFSKKGESLEDLLSVPYKDKNSRVAVERELRKNKGKGACFILDDASVYERKLASDSAIITGLIKKTFLPLSMIIVTSRFSCSLQQLGNSHNLCIKVSELSSSQIHAYIDTYPFSNDSSKMASKLKLFLSRHPNIFQVCRLPINIAVICSLFDVIQENIPHRRTPLYEMFIMATLLRHTSQNKACRLKSLNELCGEEKVKFMSLCKLAFDMTTHYDEVVSRNDRRFTFNDDSILGLLTMEHYSRDYSEEDLYSFGHLIFQEFLAAFYLSNLDECNQKFLMNSGVFGKGDFYNVWKLYFGMVEFEKSKVLIETAFDRYGYEDSDDHFQFQCAFESQQPEFCDYVLGNDSSLCFYLKNFSFPDFLAIGYVLSKTSQPLTKLIFSHCNWNKDACEGVSALSLMADKRKLSSIKHLEICSFENTKDQFKAFNCLLGQLPSLEELLLTDIVFSANSVEYLTRNVKLSKLQSVRINLPLPPISYPENALKNLTFESQDIKNVYFTAHQNCDYTLWKKLLRYAFGFQVFQNNDISWVHLYNSDIRASINIQERLSWCTEVVLVNCCIDDEEARNLACSLNSSLLESIVLDFNKISDTGVVSISRFMAKCSTIKEVSIQCNLVGNTGAIDLATSLIHSKDLRKLDLQGNCLSNDGAATVAKVLKDFPNVDLYLHNLNITEEGLQKVLKQRPRTNVGSMIFNSSWDGICDAGMSALKSALYGKTIPALKLSKTNINELGLLTNELGQLKCLTALHCTDLSDATLPTLCDIICRLKSLVRLECDEVSTISPTSDQLLCETLNTCKGLQVLAFHSSYSNVYSMISLDSMAWHNIHSLDLLGEDIGPKSMKKLFDNPKAWAHLHTLILCGKSIDSRGAEVIGNNVLCSSQNLKVLNLSKNYIDDRGAIALAEGLKHHINLQSLRLGRNQITYKGIRALLPVIKQNSLQCLDISQCELGSVGINDLLGAIDWTSLQTLNLSGNELTLYDIVSLSRALKGCTKLLQLYISFNNIGSQGLAYLNEGLQCCKDLQVLDVSSNKVTSDGIPHLLSIIKTCKRLREVNLEGNSINMKDAAALVGEWNNKSLLTLNLARCQVEDTCDDFLELYYSNDYVHIELLGLSEPPKLISAEK